MLIGSFGYAEARNLLANKWLKRMAEHVGTRTREICIYLSRGYQPECHEQ